MNKDRVEAIKGESKAAIENAEEIEDYCDITDCILPALAENWLEWIVKHNDYATTDSYAHYCKGHFTALYALYGKRRINVVIVSEVIRDLDAILRSE